MQKVSATRRAKGNFCSTSRTGRPISRFSRPWSYGDALNLDLAETFKSAAARSGGETRLDLAEEELRPAGVGLEERVGADLVGEIEQPLADHLLFAQQALIPDARVDVAGQQVFPEPEHLSGLHECQLGGVALGRLQHRGANG